MPSLPFVVVSRPRSGARQRGMNSIHSIVYTVTDLPAAQAVHSAYFGVEPHTDSEYYVGYHVGGVEIALRPGDQPAVQIQVAVEDIEAALDAVERAGGARRDAPNDIGGGLIATATDPAGNVLGLIQGT